MQRTEQASRNHNSAVAVVAAAGTVAAVDYAATEAAAATHYTAAAGGTAAPECSRDRIPHAWRAHQQRRRTSADNSGMVARILPHWSFSRRRMRRCSCACRSADGSAADFAEAEPVADQPCCLDLDCWRRQRREEGEAAD